MRSRWTVLLISEDNKSMKKTSVSSSIFILAAVLFVSLTVFSGIAGYRLYTLRADLTRIDNIKQVNKQQKKQLAVLTDKVVKLDTEMNDLRCFNRHLSEIAKIDLETHEEIVGIGGGEVGSGSGTISESMNSEVLTEKIITRKLHSHIKQIEDDIDVENQISRELLTELERQRSLMAHTPSIWPSRGWVSSSYGWRNSPFTGRRHFHKGIDIAARQGTPIFAPADGIVTAYKKNGGYGNFLVINHGYGIVTRYGHLKASNVEVGQQIVKGDKIAFIGNTGRSTGPHLHYEVLVNGIHVNPQRYMLK